MTDSAVRRGRPPGTTRRADSLYPLAVGRAAPGTGFTDEVITTEPMPRRRAAAGR